MRIFFIRHGQCIRKDTEHVLTKEGLQQAKAVANKLTPLNIKKCYVSSSKRAMQTFEEFKKLKRNVEVEISPNLKEIYHGVLSSPEIEEIDNEKLQADIKRIDKILEKIIKEKRDTVVFAHEHIIKYFLCKFLEINPEGKGRKIPIGCSSMSIVEKKDNENIFRIKTINDINHLDQKEIKKFHTEYYVPDNYEN